MDVKQKYQKALQLGEDLQVKDGYVEVLDGQLKLGGTAEYQHHKNLIWDAIKEAAGEDEPTDIMADIKVARTDFFAPDHVVKSGESLSKIAKHYYDDPMKYTAIFDANKDKLDNPDIIHPDQELRIPFV